MRTRRQQAGPAPSAVHQLAQTPDASRSAQRAAAGSEQSCKARSAASPVQQRLKRERASEPDEQRQAKSRRMVTEQAEPAVQLWTSARLQLQPDAEEEEQGDDLSASEDEAAADCGTNTTQDAEAAAASQQQHLQQLMDGASAAVLARLSNSKIAGLAQVTSEQVSSEGDRAAATALVRLTVACCRSTRTMASSTYAASRLAQSMLQCLTQHGGCPAA